MTSQPPLDETPSKSVTEPPSFFRARSSQIRAYISNRRRWLWTCIILALVGLIIGIVLIAHKRFVEFGGQGFLETRGEYSVAMHLPQRQIRHEIQARGKNVPYYVCGDQLHSCKAFELSHVCCPVNMYCHQSSATLSGIICCNSTSSANCRATKENPPQCPRNAFQCSFNTGGGCCRNNTTCSPNGCIRITGPSIISDKSAMSKTSSLEEYCSVTTRRNGNASEPTGSIITTTVTERPAAIATDLKQGEVAHSGQPHPQTSIKSLWLPYIAAFSVMLMALLIGYL